MINKWLSVTVALLRVLVKWQLFGGVRYPLMIENILNFCLFRWLDNYFVWRYIIIIVIKVFYCGLVVHITDTRAQKMVSYTVAHYRIGVCTWPTLRGAKHFNSTYFCKLGLYTLHAHFFTTQNIYWWDANTETIHQQLLHLVFIMQECWIIEEKWRFVKSIRHLKRSNKKVRWRCASYKKSIQIVSQ